jgi:hypothetical protein
MTVRKQRLGRNRPKSAIGFSNEQFLSLLTQLTGITPVGVLGRETPLDLTSLEAARGSLLVKEVFSKYDDGTPSLEKETRTWERFHEAEEACRVVNEKLVRCAWNSDPFWIMVRARIREVLGTFDWNECAEHFAFGPGATTRLNTEKRYAAYKYSGIPECTPGNLAAGIAAICSVPLWKQSITLSGGTPDQLLKLVPGNKVITVPKNYKTDRTIAKEPDMNIYIQKGIGRVLRHRLQRMGLNLNDQTRNQTLAQYGSETGSLATVDLSMASDTIAREVVSYLLPPEWFWALELARSHFGVLPSGEKLYYQKFSSMGNGFTFELETLIFWAITQTCCHPTNIWETEVSVCVYGDDIIVPTQFYGLLCEKLMEAGFTPNPSKSYSEGPYRESCGKHYFNGIDITPFYVRKPVKTLDRLFLAHNNVYRWGERTSVDVSLGLRNLRSLAPAKWREPRLPNGFGDGAFIGSIDELRLDSHPHGWEFWQVSVLSKSQKELEDDLPYGQIIASLKANESIVFSDPALRKVGLEEYNSGIPAREGGYKEIHILVPRYPRSI